MRTSEMKRPGVLTHYGVSSHLFRVPLMDEAGEHGDAAAPAPAAKQDDFAEKLAARVKQMVDSAVEPIRQKQAEQDEKLAEMAKPQSQSGADPRKLFGGAPAIRQGESALCENRGYSFGRALQALAKQDFSNAKLELDVHNKLMDTYGSTGGHGPKFLLPLGARHLQGVDDSVRREIAAVVRQGVSAIDLDEVRWMAGRVNQDLSMWDESLGGALLGSVQQGELIDLIRSKEIISRLGATEFTFPSNGRIQWPRMTSDMSGYWVGEAQNITESNIGTGLLTMIAKKLAAICDVPNDLLRFQTISSEQLIRNSIAAAFARKLDVAALTGTGSENEPRGIVNYSTVNSFTASTVGANGNTFEPGDVYMMAAKVAEQDHDLSGFAYVMRPQLWAAIKTRRNDSVSAGDGQGSFVFQTEAASDKAISGRLGGYPVVDSTQVRNDRTKGSGTDLTEIIGGVWNELLVGRVGVIEFDMDPYSGVAGTNFKKDMVSVRAIQYVDVAPRHPEAFVHCDTLVNG